MQLQSGVTRTLKILLLAIAVTAFIVLAKFGLALWVFIPVLPAGVLFFYSVIAAKRRATKPEPKAGEGGPDSRRAA